MNEKHFEDVWVEAEKVAEEYYKKGSPANHFFRLPAQVKYLAAYVVSEDISKEERTEHMGKLLLALCHYSKEYNIDVWPALREAANNAKLELLDPEVAELSDKPTKDSETNI